MTNNTRIALLISLMVNAVVFGVGAVVILAIPVLNANAIYLLPAWIGITILLTPPVSRVMAPWLRSRRYQEQHFHSPAED